MSGEPGLANDPPADSLIAERRAVLAFPLGFTPLAYLAAIAAAEFATALADARLGMAMHAFILSALLGHSAFVASESYRRLLLALSLAPLIRILSLSMPLEDVELVYWYGIVAVPLFVASLVVARTLGLGRRDLGLALGFIPSQLLIACTGFALGIIEYFILEPDPLIEGFSWRAVWAPALILLLGTGFTEELVFRGVMQSAARDTLGKLGILYITILFATLHVGYRSAVDVAFVFVVGLFFAWAVMRTGSILGVSLSHGITNIALYLLVPFLIAG